MAARVIFDFYGRGEAAQYALRALVTNHEPRRIVLDTDVREFDTPVLLVTKPLLVSCHWPHLFDAHKLAGYDYALNLHPNLSRYPGGQHPGPVARALANGVKVMSVGCHLMADKPDQGEVLAELFVDIPPDTGVEDCYRLLYPLYGKTLLKALERL